MDRLFAPPNSIPCPFALHGKAFVSVQQVLEFEKNAIASLYELIELSSLASVNRTLGDGLMHLFKYDFEARYFCTNTLKVMWGISGFLPDFASESDTA